MSSEGWSPHESLAREFALYLFRDPVMLSDNAKDLAKELRLHVGPDQAGVGPGMSQLVGLWGSRDTAALRPAIDELENLGFFRVDRGIAASPTGVGSEYDVRGIVGVAVTEALQDYLDNSA